MWPDAEPGCLGMPEQALGWFELSSVWINCKKKSLLEILFFIWRWMDAWLEYLELVNIHDHAVPNINPLRAGDGFSTTRKFDLIIITTCRYTYIIIIGSQKHAVYMLMSCEHVISGQSTTSSILWWFSKHNHKHGWHSWIRLWPDLIHGVDFWN